MAFHAGSYSRWLTTTYSFEESTKNESHPTIGFARPSEAQDLPALVFFGVEWPSNYKGCFDISPSDVHVPCKSQQVPDTWSAISYQNIHVGDDRLFLESKENQFHPTIGFARPSEAQDLASLFFFDVDWSSNYKGCLDTPQSNVHVPYGSQQVPDTWSAISSQVGHDPLLEPKENQFHPTIGFVRLCGESCPASPYVFDVGS
eukprot:CAMPEP_0113640534 /NCGR_PEP_ID=MMETSP0017_2-20120614/21276_1 /TAXON_ID=2856 /ORGANISM="Cylindrotheca closterium" /LENGTH=201 /DNA_ID=CAMNT_0000551825 /DNA_START=274 /DNA_END=880 /DNA_ORIENTATION=+ /assembly_acc=CAM_ASM_000147